MSASSVVHDTGYHPRVWQREAHINAIGKRFVVDVVHRRGGKTWQKGALMDDAAWAHKGGDGQFAFIAPQLKQAKRIVWKIFKQLLLGAPGIRFNEADNSIHYPNGSTIYLYGTESGQADSIRGMYFDGIVIDEYASMSPDVFEEVLYPTVVDRKGWIHVIGTPKGMNQFFELYELAKQDKRWATSLYDVHDTGVFDELEIDEMQSIMSPTKFRQEMLCDWTASGDDVLIPIDLIIEATKRGVKDESDLDGLPKILGIDIARFGDDRSVIQKRWGHLAYDPIIYDQQDNMQMAAHIASLINEWQPHQTFIDGSPASYGVIDRLRMLGHEVIAVDFGGKPVDQGYKDKRTEMWDKTSIWLDEGGTLPDNREFKRDLCRPTYDHTPSGQMVLESKRSMRKDGGKSTDIGDALALTFAFDVAPPHFTSEFAAAVDRLAGSKDWSRRHINAIGAEGDWEPMEGY